MRLGVPHLVAQRRIDGQREQVLGVELLRGVKLAAGRDTGYKQLVTRTRACHVEQVSLRFVYAFHLSDIADRG